MCEGNFYHQFLIKQINQTFTDKKESLSFISFLKKRFLLVATGSHSKLSLLEKMNKEKKNHKFMFRLSKALLHKYSYKITKLLIALFCKLKTHVF